MILWLARETVEAIHEQQLIAHGGRPGFNGDEGKLLAILASPRNIEAYRDSYDLADLAGCYAHRIATGHPFLEGNKRTSWVVIPNPIDQNPWAHWRSPMDMMRQG